MMMKIRNLSYNGGHENLFLFKFRKQRLREDMITLWESGFFSPDSWEWCWNKTKWVQTCHEHFQLTINHHSMRFGTKFPVRLPGVSICTCIFESTRGKKPVLSQEKMWSFAAGSWSYSPLEASSLSIVSLHMTWTSLQAQDDGKCRAFVFHATKYVQVKTMCVANSRAMMEVKGSWLGFAKMGRVFPVFTPNAE